MKIKVKNGVDRISEYYTYFKDKKIGIITNITGITKDFKSTIEQLDDIADVTVIFAPEHGIRGDKQAGVALDSYYDDFYQKKVISLYGDKKAPSSDDLNDLDMLVYDIQDIGVRYYTYIYTMYLSLLACEKADVEFVVLDRIEIFGGNKVLGNIMTKELYSFVGMLPIPNVYGMTIGELAEFCRIEYNISVTLKIIKVTGWKRGISYAETDLPWVPPSPNIPTITTADYYVGTCLFEGTNLSEGRGTTLPFQQIGAPWLKNDVICMELNQIYKDYDIYFQPVFFTPTFSKHEGVLCNGIMFHINDFKSVDMLSITLKVIETIKKYHKKEFKIDVVFENSEYLFFEHLTGHVIGQNSDKNLSIFENKRNSILMYD